MGMILNLVAAVLLAAAAWIDARTMEIPDRFHAALAVCGAAAICFVPDISVTDRLIGAFCVSVPMYLVCTLIPEAFGGGDIKLTFVMGFYLGWKLLLVGTVLGFLFGGIQAMFLIASGKVKSGEHAHMAFGPALCLGFMIAMTFGEPLLRFYLGLFY
ncbi:MAG: prepilin peptidase [Lachnospiraceae bacterium]|nr:prepilin peptidase [Lachnospiraceae bacterium]